MLSHSSHQTSPASDRDQRRVSDTALCDDQVAIGIAQSSEARNNSNEISLVALGNPLPVGHSRRRVATIPGLTEITSEFDLNPCGGHHAGAHTVAVDNLLATGVGRTLHGGRRSVDFDVPSGPDGGHAGSDQRDLVQGWSGRALIPADISLSDLIAMAEAEFLGETK